MGIIGDPVTDGINIWLQSLQEMSWLVMGNASHVLMAGFIVLMMFTAIMKGLGVILRR